MNPIHLLQRLCAVLIISTSAIASLYADTIRYDDYSGPAVIESVIVIEETPARVEYLRFIQGQHVLKAWISDDGAMSVKPGTIRVERSTPEEKQALLETLPKAKVTRRMGPPVTLCSPGFHYPLPSKVNYIMGSPTPMRATGIYAGETKDDAVQVHFKDVSELSTLHNGKKNQNTLEQWQKTDQPGPSRMGIPRRHRRTSRSLRCERRVRNLRNLPDPRTEIHPFHPISPMNETLERSPRIPPPGREESRMS